MKNILRVITGLTIILLSVPSVIADYCNPNMRTGSTYESIYCDISREWNEEKNEEILKTMSKQMKWTDKGEDIASLIQLMLDEGENISCSTAKNIAEKKGFTLPNDIKEICKEGAENILNKWVNIVNKIDKIYQKEKVLYQIKKQMTYEFKASEKYWDGQILDTGDAPFDLIVDLNIIEKILFGSEAKWVNPNDVFRFPSKNDNKDDNDKNEGDIDFIPIDEEGDDKDDSDKDEMGGMNIDEKEYGGKEQECVSADDPNADMGDNPGSSYTNINCGNGTVDLLLGENCDDGNMKSGDGCSQYCTIENGVNGNGNTDSESFVCKYPSAITFKSANRKNSTNTDGNTEDGIAETSLSDNNDNPCPPGTFPKKETEITGSGSNAPKEYPQSEEYPGPFIGGTLKQSEPNKKPVCQNGYSEIGVNVFGEEKIAQKKDGKPRCIPTELCGDINEVRDFLAGGSDWRKLPEDDPKRQAIESIEALFCVTITKANRPESAYQINEGCIDCHMSAIIDSLDKALETNVSPLENTTGGFAISGRWGPKFSFNLTTSIKSTLKLVMPSKTGRYADEFKKYMKKLETENQKPEGNFNIEESSKEKLERREESEKQRTEAIAEGLKNYRISSKVISDQTFAARIKPLLIQMKESFERINAKYMKLSDPEVGIQLHKKNQCKF